ncbi:MAG: hypothetical protein AAF485_00435 [Chloroflexota bacterium]
MTHPTPSIKKVQLEEMVMFTITHVPQIDTTTLTQFLELVNVGGNYGLISHQHIVEKMRLIMKYIPGACIHSLLTLMDLLNIDLDKIEAPATASVPHRLPASETMFLLPAIRETVYSSVLEQ